MAAFLILIGTAAAEPVRGVVAFNTNQVEPFLKESDSGLVPELVRHLGRELGARFRLQLNNLPRQRLLKIDMAPPEAFAGIVLLMAPAFVDDAEQKTYLWTDPLFVDYNVIVVPVEKAPARLSLDWLVGKEMATVRGHRYAILGPLLADGRLAGLGRVDERSAMRTVAAGRADFAQMNHLVFQHLIEELDLSSRLVGIPEPGGASFQRRILVGKAAADLLPPLNHAVANLHCNTEWRRTAASYGFAPMACKLPEGKRAAP